MRRLVVLRGVRGAFIAFGLTCFGAAALEPGEALPDAALESRARGLSAELRCMVCQNQSIDDSNAPLAKDLRLLLRERLNAGDSDAQVIEYLTARYGEYVLLKPRFGPHTLLLWLGPALVLTLGALGLLLAMRRRDIAEEPAALSTEEQAKLRDVLRD